MRSIITNSSCSAAFLVLTLISGLCPSVNPLSSTVKLCVLELSLEVDLLSDDVEVVSELSLSVVPVDWVVSLGMVGTVGTVGTTIGFSVVELGSIIIGSVTDGYVSDGSVTVGSVSVGSVSVGLVSVGSVSVGYVSHIVRSFVL